MSALVNAAGGTTLFSAAAADITAFFPPPPTREATSGCSSMPLDVDVSRAAVVVVDAELTSKCISGSDDDDEE